MTKEDQIKELAEVIKKDYPEVNADHIATIAVEWFNSKRYFITAQEQTHYFKDGVMTWLVGFKKEKKDE